MVRSLRYRGQSRRPWVAIQSQRVWGIRVEFDESLFNHTVDYIGCRIRTASFEVEPKRWQPEACMQVQTENGPRKLWLQSFAHCFGAEKLTFGDRLAADEWALAAAKAIIDRASEKLESNRQGQPSPDVGYFSRMLSLTRQSFTSLRRLKPTP